ncbi:uncharacterized protein LOC143227099 [Tachypleus tridentatus]|uniref:uncharacterized protein LOC143227099 n=1 Tax=Tachypleus tridentatus TaxID=6853 RepID=UPI003FD1752E
MRVLFVALVVLLTLTSTKGNIIHIGSNIICKMNKESPEKVNDLRECLESILKEKSEWLPGAFRDCEFGKLPYQKYDEFLNEMCREERYDDVQDIEECVGKIYAAVQEDPENILDEMIYKCL